MASSGLSLIPEVQTSNNILNYLYLLCPTISSLFSYIIISRLIIDER